MSFRRQDAEPPYGFAHGDVVWFATRDAIAGGKLIEFEGVWAVIEVWEWNGSKVRRNMRVKIDQLRPFKDLDLD